MKRESFQGVLLGIVIMCAVFAFITVAWAALNSTLTISGTATVSAQSWKVGFGKLENSTYSVYASADTLAPAASSAAPTNDPRITSTSFGLSADSTPVRETLANFTTPGESVVYTWYTVNEGTFDAIVTASQGFLVSPVSPATKATPAGSNVGLTCTSSDTSKLTNEAAQTFCDNYIKALLTINGTTYYSDTISAAATAPTLAKPTSGSTTQNTNVLTIEYLEPPVASLPAANVTVNLANPIQITYTQYTPSS